MKTELKPFRPHQTEADDAIYEELRTANKCIVKMFCGTGKSLLMRKCKSAQNQQLVVYVFPSLSLIDQFCTDYFTKVGFASPFKISSENNSTTDPALIQSEIQRGSNKIICVTYQSYNTLLENLGSTKIDVCIYDEAHHAVAPTYQELIFERNVCKKQIFFTATPKDDNGIVMCDKDTGICGRTVYDYSYLRGLSDGYVNPFEIRVDMYTENTNKSVYESIARAILVSGNNRVLTFHADVNTDRDTSVINFVNETDFVRAFMKVMADEFPEKAGVYTKFTMIALDASIPMNERRTILDKFDTTLDNNVYIISSCETIGEGIDTKNANMCVFVDPKSSFVKIIQNIGRIVRPQSKPSTVLIPCWVDKTKYVGCDEDREKCDEVIRSDLNKDGNFNGILNVLSALRQEDEELYDICLHYPDTYSPQEIRSNLEKQGYKVLDQIGDGELVETMEYLLDQEIDYDNYDDCETNEEMILRIAEDNDVCIEVHTNSFENQIEKYKSECESGEVIRLYKEEKYDDEENQIYCPIVKKCGKRRGNGLIKELDRKDRIKIDVHTNPYVKVLWKLVGDFTKEICSCVLECDVVEYDPMEVAVAIVERAKERKRNGGELMPKNKHDKSQETKDACYLINKRQCLKGKGTYLLNEDVNKYLDINLIDWRKEKNNQELAMNNCNLLIEWYNKNEKKIPKQYLKKDRIGNEEEHNIAIKLSRIREIYKKGYLYSSVEIKLDENIPEWKNDIDLKIKALTHAVQIIERAQERQKNGGKLLPGYKDIEIMKKQKNPIIPIIIIETQEIENNDKQKLGYWKQALDGTNRGECPNNVRDILDKNLPGWRDKHNLCNKALELAKNIIIRANERKKNGRNMIPKNYYKKEDKLNPILKQETSDYGKMSRWRDALDGKKIGQYICPDEVRDILDEHLKGWRTPVEEETTKPKKSMKLKEPSVKKETLEQKRIRTKSELSVLHQRYKTLNSKNLQKEFQETPELWRHYHAISEENEKSFPEESIPRNRIIQELTQIKTKRTRSVVDMGCGRAHIADHFANDTRFSFINYDHISCKENILVQDISRTPLEDDSIEICILCLAMWGSNCHDYVREAHRILESGGKLYIMEATKRWTSVVEATESEAIKVESINPAGKLETLLKESGFQIVKSSIEKFALFVCTK
jgi:superfamily II DNA or RNA helicase